MKHSVLQTRYLETLDNCTHQLTMLAKVLENGNSPTVDAVILARAYVVLVINMKAIHHLRAAYMTDFPG